MINSGKQGASALIYTGPCKIYWVLFTGDTAKEPTLTIYDYASAGGTAKFFAMVSDENHSFFVAFPKGEEIVCDIGIYAALSAAEGDYIIQYEPR